MADIDFYKTIADRMIKDDKARDFAFKKYQEMFHSDWNLPSEVAKIQWIHKVVNTGPHDAIATAVRVIAGGKVRPRLIPLVANAENRKRANDVEIEMLENIRILNHQNRFSE